MKKCVLCREEKSLSCFNKRKASKDGLQTVCRECNRLRAQKYYKENREKHKKVIYERKLKIKERNQKRLFDFLLSNPCVECGEANPLVLEFNHLRNKRKEVSLLLLNGHSWKVIEKEIEKCQVLCANCHSIKTHKQKNTYRYKLANLGRKH